MDVSSVCESTFAGTLVIIVGLPIIPCLLLSYPLLGRHFDPLIREQAFPDFWLGLLGKLILRPIGYAFFIVVNPDWKRIKAKNSNRDPERFDLVAMYIRTYGNIDYREEASWLQLGFSLLYVSSLLLVAPVGLLLAPCT